MIAAILMGLVAGARSMTPLAAIAWLARRDGLPNNAPFLCVLSSSPVVAGATLLAAGEILGDKMRSAPDRTVAPGMAARAIIGALAGAALSPRRNERVAALLGATSAVLSSYATFELRRRAMRRHGQRPTGAIEDIAAVACAAFVASAAKR